jgi:hypothetical protein
MTPLEDDLRAAMRATAKKIPPGPPPPLTLPKRRRLIRPLSPGYWSRRSRAFALATVFLIGAVVAASLALGTVFTGHRSPVSLPFRPQPASVLGVPAYYVALTSPDGYLPGIPPEATTATIRATVTGKVLATVAVPRPYGNFTAVAAATDDRTFVLAAETGKVVAPQKNPGPAARFFVLHLDPASPTAAGQVRLQALPASYIPAGTTMESMALSADGTSLAAVIGDFAVNKLYVYHLTTGERHFWYATACGRCTPAGVGLGSGDADPGTLSWAADGKTLAFLFVDGDENQDGIRLLNTSSRSTNLLADSKLSVARSRIPFAAEAVLTPDGQTIFTVQIIASAQGHARQQLESVSAATGHLIAVLNQVSWRANFEQIQWTNASGSQLLISGPHDTGSGAGVLKGGRYTPIPWSSKIFAAAW